MLQRQNLTYTLLSIFLDFCTLLFALILAEWIRNTLDLGRNLGEPEHIPPLVFLMAIGAWLGSFTFLAIYDPQNHYRFFQEIQRVVLGAIVILLLLSGGLYFSHRDLSRLLVVYFFGLLLFTLVAWRVLFRIVQHSIFAQSEEKRRVVILGEGAVFHTIVDTVQAYAQRGALDMVGVISNGPHRDPEKAPHLGLFSQAKPIIEAKKIDDVIMVLPHHEYKMLTSLVVELQKLPIQIHVIPDYFNLALYRATVETFANLPLVNLRAPALSPYQRLVKRVFDLIIATILTLALLPLMAVIALAIKLEDRRGKVIFKQTRVGENGRLFKMYKFRSMYEGAENQPVPSTAHATGEIPNHKMPNDPRVTRVGQFLRRTSLDELPQFFNVLKGEMSLVGPRPEMPWLVDQYQSWQRTRFAVPQGITGWWQIRSRAEQPMLLHTEDDLYYIQHYSIWLDIWIMLQTLRVLFYRQGAY